jgi:hypothetical protein
MGYIVEKYTIGSVKPTLVKKGVRFTTIKDDVTGKLRPAIDLSKASSIGIKALGYVDFLRRHMKFVDITRAM